MLLLWSSEFESCLLGSLTVCSERQSSTRLPQGFLWSFSWFFWSWVISCCCCCCCYLECWLLSFGFGLFSCCLQGFPLGIINYYIQILWQWIWVFVVCLWFFVSTSVYRSGDFCVLFFCFVVGVEVWNLEYVIGLPRNSIHSFAVVAEKKRGREVAVRKVQAFALEELCFFEKPLLFLRSSLCSVPYQLAVVAKELKEELQL